MGNTKPQKEKSTLRNGSIPRQVRMPPDLDEWLEQEAAADNLPKSVADKIREIVAEAREAQRRQDQAA